MSKIIKIFERFQFHDRMVDGFELFFKARNHKREITNHQVTGSYWNFQNDTINEVEQISTDGVIYQ